MATKRNLPESMHGDVDQLANQLALADAAHSSNIKDLNSIKSVVGNKDIGSNSAFKGKLADIKESDLAERAANLDVSTLKNLKEKFPSAFEKAKTAKINDLISSSSHPTNGFNDNTFFKKYDNLEPETRELIFDKQMQNHIESLRTVKQATPDKLGPSGTPKGLMFMDMISPKRNLTDFAIKKGLEEASAGGDAKLLSAVAPKVKTPNKISPLLRLLGGPSDTPLSAAVMPAAAQNDSPKKGESKWASDGVDKLIEHTSDADKKARYEKLKSEIMKNPKLKQLVINASDLTPGSKAMQNIQDQIDKQLDGKDK